MKSIFLDVKNVDNTFTKIARHERVRFIGNVSIGSDVKVSELRRVRDFINKWMSNHNYLINIFSVLRCCSLGLRSS